mmetsp:Transcript_13840/g.20992  ORF Transcript_13840/g.20992 Transcript_13840/m.20992 type:complete len:171 (-) Transcript_13840:1223-1735(-)
MVAIERTNVPTFVCVCMNERCTCIQSNPSIHCLIYQKKDAISTDPTRISLNHACAHYEFGKGTKAIQIAALLQRETHTQQQTLQLSTIKQLNMQRWWVGNSELQLVDDIRRYTRLSLVLGLVCWLRKTSQSTCYWCKTTLLLRYRNRSSEHIFQFTIEFENISIKKTLVF